MSRLLRRADPAHVTAYVLLSLGTALAGSMAAIALALLVQPSRASTFGHGLLAFHPGVVVLAAGFGAATSIFALLRWLTARLGARIASHYALSLRCEVHAHLIDAPLPALADSTSGEIASVLTYNSEIVTQGFNALLQLLVAGTTTIVNLAFAIWVSPPLALGLPMLVALGLLASRFYGREQSQVSRRYIRDLTRLFRQSEDFPGRLRHVRSFERADMEKARYAAISEQLSHGYRRQLELAASGRLLLELLSAVGMAVVFLLANRWQGVDQASLIAVGLLLGRLLPYLSSTRQSFQQLRLAAPAFELWQRYASLHPEHHKPVSSHGSCVHELCIERIRLKLPVVDLDIENLILSPGELTLITGESGIGKSSLIDVLSGMKRPASFSASVGGRCIDFDGYRQFVKKGAYVSQNVKPWQHSVRECLLWAAPEATEQTLRRVLSDVGLDPWLAAARDGLDSVLRGSSSQLSGGELQRLLLAQVILRQPHLALLDEATNALDAASEIRMLSILRDRLPQAILIVVSHRTGVASIANRHLDIGAGRSVARASGYPVHVLTGLGTLGKSVK
ncbi:MAG TPA: ABC transporter ATP-binding protein [Rhodanobacteraceae bacterium]|nr:ABC transporter ATP-binding protein [Rhodanobacteraceae bacterium]